MKTPAQNTHTTTDSTSTKMGITIIYEDRATGLNAKRFSDMLLASLGETEPSAPACWRCELIDLPEMAREIALDAAGSEFVILSLRGDRGLSVAAKNWIEAWLENATSGPASLIALFDPARSTMPHAESLRYFLRHAAASAGVAFFAHCAVAPVESPAFVPQNEQRNRLSHRSSGNVVASYFPAHIAA